MADKQNTIAVQSSSTPDKSLAYIAEAKRNLSLSNTNEELSTTYERAKQIEMVARIRGYEEVEKQASDLKWLAKRYYVENNKAIPPEQTGRGNKGVARGNTFSPSTVRAWRSEVGHIPVDKFVEKLEQSPEPITRQQLRSEKLKQSRAEPPPAPDLPAETYSVIYADPPWRYDHSETTARDIENQYPTMTLDEIKALPVTDIAAPDCVLFLWATSPKLAECLEVVAAWGFLYRTCAVWVKDKIGMGYYFRQRHELLLVATRGKPGVPAVVDRADSVIEFPRLAHSEKPEMARVLIEDMYPHHRRIELFARSKHENWETWGNEATA